MDMAEMRRLAAENRGERAKEMAERVAHGLPAMKTPEERAAEAPNSLMRAITAMCWQCMGKEPGWKNMVRDCTAPKCALYPHRPGHD